MNNSKNVNNVNNANKEAVNGQEVAKKKNHLDALNLINQRNNKNKITNDSEEITK